MRADDLVVGLDIGTTKISVIIAEKNEYGSFEVIGVSQLPSQGIRKGVVVNIEKVVHEIRAAVEAAEIQAGREVSGLYISITGGHVEGINSKGVVAISGRGREIEKSDIDRVIEAARAIAMPMDREIIHIIPQEFSIDQQHGVKNPLGMTGVRLEGSVHIVTGTVSNAQMIIKCVEKAGYTPLDIVLEPLASAKAVLTEDEKELGVALLDIGGGTTDLLVYLQGAPWYTDIYDLGGNQVTSDISIGLKLPLQTAENIKKDYGIASLDIVNPEQIMEIPGVGGREPRKIRRLFLAEVIEPRIREIFQIVKEVLLKNEYYEKLGGGIVLTGGTVMIPGIIELGCDVFGLPVRIGNPFQFGGLKDEYHKPSFATGLGLVMYGSELELQQGYSTNRLERGLSGVIKRVGGWLKEFF